MKSPAAWIPSAHAAQRLRDLARSLGIFSEGEPLEKTVNGPQLITAPSRVINNFPLRFDKQTRTLTVPGIYVDFATWQYLPPQEVSGGPSANQKGWLRMVVNVTYDEADFWATINVGTPYLEWVSFEEVGNIIEADQWFRNFDTDDYYRYIVRLFDDEKPKPWAISSPLVKQPLDLLT
jgi:hypothetical protein